MTFVSVRSRDEAPAMISAHTNVAPTSPTEIPADASGALTKSGAATP